MKRLFRMILTDDDSIIRMVGAFHLLGTLPYEGWGLGTEYTYPPDINGCDFFVFE